MSLEPVLATARDGRLYPSVILHGGSLEDRREAALELARTLLCAREVERRPCGECRHCRRIAWPGGDARFHPDFAVLERDLKTATSVDATKEFLRGAQVTPFEARGQVFVVASAESLSGEAANALLKTLEEPPERAPRNFLLLAPSQFDLLPTLRSRSLAVYLGGGERAADEELQRHASRFARALQAYRRSANEAELLAAAARLADCARWDDPRAQRPWEIAAEVVLRAGRELAPEAAPPGPLLALAEELVGAFRMRVRGIPAKRILEGLVHRHLGGASPSAASYPEVG